MQSLQGSSSGAGAGTNGGPSNRNGQYYPLPTSIFPVQGSRPAGVDGQTNPQQPQPPIIAHGLTQAEIERHQRPAHLTGEDAEGKDYRAGFFPIPGNKWSWGVVGEEGNQSSGSGTSMSQHGQAESSTMASNNNNHLSQAYQSDPQITQQPGGGENSDSISAFLSEMPTRAEDPTRHVLWTELIKLKTRTLELQIAEARKKEKEAELEIMRLKAGAAAKDGTSGNGNNDGNASVGNQHLMGPGVGGGSSNGNHNDVGRFSLHPQQSSSSTSHGLFSVPPPAMSPFDLEAMLSTENMDNFLSWLPDLGDHPLPDTLPLAPTTDYSSTSNGENNGNLQFSLDHANTNTIFAQHSAFPPVPDTTNIASQSQSHPQSFPRRRSASAEKHSPAQLQPPSKKTRRGTEKKLVVEHTSSCQVCKKNIARIMIRSPKSTMPDPILIQLNCTGCVPINQPSTISDSSSTNTGIGTVETRKRIRVQMEIDDEEMKARERKQWCDVCQRIIASGQVLGGSGREQETISGMTEIVCGECDSKYQRCTDCGGGGGPRVGIGKWRMKQVFHPGRKTCSLNHTRLGDRVRELGVHVTPTDFTPEQIKEVLTRCKALWNEKTLARLAVPEMLEVDLPPGLSNPLRDFGDVDDIITRNWPSREAMIKADGLDPNKFRRLLSLIWAHSKPRRSVRTVDLEEEWSKNEDNDDDLSTVLANVKRTNVVIPPGSELIGMWGGEWNLQNGSLLISTFIPFEGADGEDSTALSVGEMITKVQSLQQEINAERTEQAKREGKQPELLPPCQHLWTVSGGYIPLVRERFADILIRKRSFVHVEEYLTRHPEFIESIRARPVGLHPDIHRALPLTQTDTEEDQPKPLILVRWLGKEFDAAKILEIKQMEFGGGAKRKKRKL
ncbi:hypothetical protein I302_101560 [Kwoniella bestiolae CBS 10118]|uniref:Uncharacterized protein n=1 Tax=Kwoniella bestiolae CBS 10118 TaxID=1296100 RepID=A0A1B9GCL3_9TREE|nr:hypothetical protein I302_00243 [Kwoniella bestiolae CBS 10118]OCF28754.1 hypothetical protein I302_00243 [Kwoniella bestiolae CBS 10118]